MGHGFAAAVAAALLLAGPTDAGEAQDKIFRLGLLQGVETGETLVFDRTRGGSLTTEGVPAIDGGSLEVSLLAGEDGREARIDLRDGDGATSRSVVPADGGHPALLVFLESNARAMSELTGGSPFYIRNRMREALGEEAPLEPVEITVGGATAPAEAVTFRPFETDPNRSRMGPFADLEIRIVLSDAVPGAFARFEAVAGPDQTGVRAYGDVIAFSGLKGE